MVTVTGRRREAHHSTLQHLTTSRRQRCFERCLLPSSWEQECFERSLLPSSWEQECFERCLLPSSWEQDCFERCLLPSSWEQEDYSDGTIPDTILHSHRLPPLLECLIAPGLEAPCGEPTNSQCCRLGPEAPCGEPTNSQCCRLGPETSERDIDAPSTRRTVAHGPRRPLVWVWAAALVGVFALLGDQGTEAAPRPPLRAFVEDTTQRYLMQYGYLPMSDMEMGNLRTDEELVDAVRRLQRFGNIPVTGVVDVATKDLMRRPRCSLPDILPDEVSSRYLGPRHNRIRRYIKQGSTWDKMHLTWGIISYPGQPDGRAVERELLLATELWARPSKLRFSQVTDRPGSADIVVQFNRGYHGDGYPFDGAGRTLAHAFYPGPGIGGDIHFDADERWVQHVDSANSSFEEISLFQTAGHELGHALGLYHSQAQNSIMSPYLWSYGPGTFTLPPDDVAGIQDLYGVNENYESPVSDLPTVEGNSPSAPFPDSSSPSPPHLPSTLVPDTCDTSYDAISVIRRGVYVFRGKFFWRIDDRTLSQEPVELTRFWYCLPNNITRVDAVYERPNQDTIVFFSGRQYFVCRGNDELVDTGPLRRLGLPEDLDRLDAAFVWGHNTRTYFMANTMYWRFDESIKHVELDYPRDMTMWKGVPYGGIDAAFKFNGTTYFFKGKVFYEFDDLRMKVRPKSPVLSAPFWMGCPDNIENPRSAPGAASEAPVPDTLAPLTRAAVTLLVALLTLMRAL